MFAVVLRLGVVCGPTGKSPEKDLILDKLLDIHTRGEKGKNSTGSLFYCHKKRQGLGMDLGRLPV